jgi:hypothetical protein
MAPTLVTATPAPSTPASVRAKSRARRPLAYAGLCAAAVGVTWSVWHFQSKPGENAIATKGSLPAAEIAPAPADPKEAALARSATTVKKFLATADWETAKSMIAAQDTPGTTAPASFLPGRFKPLAAEGKFNPVAVTTKENAGQYQVIWEIENPHDAEKLVMTADDTPEGVRIRWYQPPYFVASQQGTRANESNQQNMALVTNQPPMAPLPVETPVADPIPAAPEAKPAATPSKEETILAAIDVPQATSKGSAPLNNTAAKQKPTDKGTASTKTPKAKITPNKSPQ